MEARGSQIPESRGANFTLFGVVGDTAAFDMNQLRVYNCIDKVMRVQSLTSVLTGCSTRTTVSSMFVAYRLAAKNCSYGRALFGRDP